MAGVRACRARSNVRRALVAPVTWTEKHDDVGVTTDEWRRLNPHAFELNRASPRGTRVQVVIGERTRKWQVFFLPRGSFPGFEPMGTFDTWDEASAMAKLFLINED